MLKLFFESLISAIKIVIVLCLVSFIIFYFLNGHLSWDLVKNQTFYNFYYGIPLSFANGYLMDIASHYIPWEKAPKRRAWVGIIGTVVVTMLTLFILNYILWVLVWDGEMRAIFSERNRMFYLIAFFITVVITSVLHAMSFFNMVIEEKVINEKLRKEKAEMELSALKAHIDPHFLFNSFNVLSGMIDEDPNKAKKLLKKLSGIYRYILENKDEDTNTIEAELGFANKYLSFQQARFEDSILIDVNVDEATMEKRLPSLSLQLLLENAIKHNAFDDENPLQIEIYKEADNLVIKNNKRKRKNLAVSNGMGLQNIRDRYLLLTKQDFIIEDQTDSFTVKLPII